MPAARSAGYAGAAWSHGNWFCGFWVGLLLAIMLSADQVPVKSTQSESCTG